MLKIAKNKYLEGFGNLYGLTANSIVKMHNISDLCLFFLQQITRLPTRFILNFMSDMLYILIEDVVDSY